MKTLADMTLKNKRVLMRLDLNMPVSEGKITDESRLLAALPTIEYARDAQAAVLIMAHFGRPTEGEYDEKFSLELVAQALSAHLGQTVRLIKEYLTNPPEVAAGEVVLLENVRFNVGEKKNDSELAKRYAALCDVFVSDGFGVVHRAQASTVGVAKFAPEVCAGFLVEKEVAMLQKVVDAPEQPLLAIVGGAKVSTKLMILKSLLDKVAVLIPAGGIANTFLAAEGVKVGNSLIEEGLIEEAKLMLAEAKQKGVALILPVDVVVGKSFAADTPARMVGIDEIADDEMILDVGEKTRARYAQAIAEAKTIVWNGPVGVFEFPAFSAGTKALCEAVASSEAFSFAGGGDTIAAINQFGVADGVDYVSTGGGSMLEYLEGKELEGLSVLKS